MIASSLNELIPVSPTNRPATGFGGGNSVSTRCATTDPGSNGRLSPGALPVFSVLTQHGPSAPLGSCSGFFSFLGGWRFFGHPLRFWLGGVGAGGAPLSSPRAAAAP